MRIATWNVNSLTGERIDRVTGWLDIAEPGERVVFQEILKRLRNHRLVSQPRRLRSNFVNGVKEMRIAFDPERS